MQNQPSTKQHHSKRFVLAILASLTVTIVITSVMNGSIAIQRASMVENIPAVSYLHEEQAMSLNGAVPFGQNADEVRLLLEQIHSSYRSQMEMMEQLSAQNSSMLSLYQQTVSSVQMSASTSYARSLEPLPSASSRSQSSVVVSSYITSSSSSFISSSVEQSSTSSSITTSTTSSSKEESVSSSVSSSTTSTEPSSMSTTSMTSHSSMFSVTPRLESLREAFGRTVGILEKDQTNIAFKLMKELTLTPPGEESILVFITADLPAIRITPQYETAVFRHFKLLNGNELKQLGVVPNADVDPKDWYAESVATVHELNIMKGSGKTGLFEGERPMNQAELATTLANAMNLAGGALARPAAQQADVFQAWPAWGKSSISELRARGIDTSFFRANPEEPVNRLQLARAISDTIFRGDTIDVSTARYFYDTVSLPVSVQQYVSKMSALGIMTGNPQTLTFDPYAQTNRAQVAKTIAYAISVKVGAKTLSSSVAH